MSCQKCKSERVIRIHCKCSDMFDMQVDGVNKSGYVPTNLFFGKDGYGDYVEVSLCVACGQIQSKFPISKAQIDKAMAGLDEF